ncbi:MAG: type II secretion system protein [Magnetococcales bacterium]|nr:type II secretion system protein [Magnetococcales bacterium]
MADLTFEKGYSLVELVMVMVIVGIIGITAGAKWQGDLSLFAKADQLVNDMRLAQALAMGKGIYTIRSVTPNSYRIQDANGAAYYPQDPVLEGVTINPFAISFDGRGDPGPLDIDLLLTLEGQTATIRMYGYTGAVRRL